MKIAGLVRAGLYVGFWLCAVFCLRGTAFAEDHPAFQPVKELFAAMSRGCDSELRVNLGQVS